MSTERGPDVAPASGRTERATARRDLSTPELSALSQHPRQDPRRYWDAVGAHWLTRRPDELWRRCSDAIHAQWLERVATDLCGKRVLKTDLFDEAFGGGLTKWFEARGNEVIACDLAFSTAKGAARKNKVTAAVADVRRLPFAGGMFDAVFSNSTLDHFHAEDEILRSLRELSRVLRPGGLLLLTMDNPRHPIVWLRNLLPDFWLRLGVVPYAVGVTCSAPRLIHLLKAAGFEVHTTGAIMHSPRVLLVPICRWLAQRNGRRQPTPRWLEWLRRVEGLGRLPLRQLTGHFVAVVARKVS